MHIYTNTYTSTYLNVTYKIENQYMGKSRQIRVSRPEPWALYCLEVRERTSKKPYKGIASC